MVHVVGEDAKVEGRPALMATVGRSLLDRR